MCSGTPKGAQDPTLRTILVIARAIATSKGGEKSERDRKIVELVEKEQAIEAELHKLLGEGMTPEQEGAGAEAAPTATATKKDAAVPVAVYLR